MSARLSRVLAFGAAASVLLAPVLAFAEGAERITPGTAIQFIPDEITPQFTEFIERWHDFYLMSGTGAVTLVGLIFIAMSLHLDIMLHHKRAHLLDLARQTVFSFVYVLIISLELLIPPSSPRMLGRTLMGASLPILLFALIGIVNELRTKESVVRRRVTMRRRLTHLFGVALAIASGYMIMKGIGAGLFLLIGPVCLMLGNGTGSAWDLMIQVGRLKLQDESAEHEPIG